MSTALVLADDGRRQNGKWAYGAVKRSGSGTSDRQWSQRLAEAGTILDHAPHLAAEVIDGGVALDAAYRQAATLGA